MISQSSLDKTFFDFKIKRTSPYNYSLQGQQLEPSQFQVVLIIGRKGVGKKYLLKRLLNEKVSVQSHEQSFLSFKQKKDASECRLYILFKTVWEFTNPSQAQAQNKAVLSSLLDSVHVCFIVTKCMQASDLSLVNWIIATKSQWGLKLIVVHNLRLEFAYEEMIKQKLELKGKLLVINASHQRKVHHVSLKKHAQAIKKILQQIDKHYNQTVHLYSPPSFLSLLPKPPRLSLPSQFLRSHSLYLLLPATVFAPVRLSGRRILFEVGGRSGEVELELGTRSCLNQVRQSTRKGLTLIQVKLVPE